MPSLTKQCLVFTLTAGVAALGLLALTEAVGRSHFFNAGLISAQPEPARTSPEPSREPPSTKAPQFRLKDIEGRTINLASLKGKVAIIDFWATWCPPCRLEVPILNNLQTKYRHQGLEIIAISLDESLDDIQRFLEQSPLNYTVVQGNETVMSQFGHITALPTTFFLDRRGNIRSQHVGFMSQAALEKKIEQLLAE